MTRFSEIVHGWAFANRKGLQARINAAEQLPSLSKAQHKILEIMREVLKREHN